LEGTDSLGSERPQAAAATYDVFKIYPKPVAITLILSFNNILHNCKNRVTGGLTLAVSCS